MPCDANGHFCDSQNLGMSSASPDVHVSECSGLGCISYNTRFGTPDPGERDETILLPLISRCHGVQLPAKSDESTGLCDVTRHKNLQ